MKKIGDLHFLAPGSVPLWPLYVKELVSSDKNSELIKKCETLNKKHEYIYVLSFGIGNFVDLGHDEICNANEHSNLQASSFESIESCNTEKIYDMKLLEQHQTARYEFPSFL